jgi:hypothetical protein
VHFNVDEGETKCIKIIRSCIYQDTIVLFLVWRFSCALNGNATKSLIKELYFLFVFSQMPQIGANICGFFLLLPSSNVSTLRGALPITFGDMEYLSHSFF